MTQTPSIVRIVRYRLSANDAEVVNRRRTTGVSIAERIKVLMWPVGAQAHIGNGVSAGDVFPMIIVRTWGNDEGSAVNGQVFLDGSDTLWVTSVLKGDYPGSWSWPEVMARAKAEPPPADLNGDAFDLAVGGQVARVIAQIAAGDFEDVTDCDD